MHKKWITYWCEWKGARKEGYLKSLLIMLKVATFRIESAHLRFSSPPFDEFQPTWTKHIRPISWRWWIHMYIYKYIIYTYNSSIWAGHPNQNIRTWSSLSHSVPNTSRGVATSYIPQTARDHSELMDNASTSFCLGLGEQNQDLRTIVKGRESMCIGKWK